MKDLARTDKRRQVEQAPTLREWVGAEYQILREMIPGPLSSPEADKLMLDMLEAIATQIGQEAFHGVILKAIETCERRPVIATFRKLAGLNSRLDHQQEQLVAAWDVVSKVLTRHVGKDGNGNIVLRSFLESTSDGHREVPVPEIPQGVKDAVRMMGGWPALVESWPAYAGQRWVQFSQMYRGEPKPAQGDHALLGNSAMQIRRSE